MKRRNKVRFNSGTSAPVITQDLDPLQGPQCQETGSPTSSAANKEEVTLGSG
jgi:hypothetical protein